MPEVAKTHPFCPEHQIRGLEIAQLTSAIDRAHDALKTVAEIGRTATQAADRVTDMRDKLESSNLMAAKLFELQRENTDAMNKGLNGLSERLSSAIMAQQDKQTTLILGYQKEISDLKLEVQAHSDYIENKRESDRLLRNTVYALCGTLIVTVVIAGFTMYIKVQSYMERTPQAPQGHTQQKG